MAAVVPTRQTSEVTLDQWNQALRQTPVYLDFMRANGLPTHGQVQLSRSQQGALERALRGQGIEIPGGMHIDQGGNLNQKNRTGRNIVITAAIVGGALATAGAAGAFSGAAGGPTAAGGATAAQGGIAALATPAAGGVIPSASIAGMHVAVPAFAGTATGFAVPAAAGTVAAGTVAAVKAATGGFFPAIGRFFNSPGGQVATNVAGNLISGAIQANAAGKATDAQERALKEALDFQKAQYAEAIRRWDAYQTQARGDYEPFKDISLRALQSAETYMNDPNRPMPSQMPQPTAPWRSSAPGVPIRQLARGQFPVTDGRVRA